MGIDEPTTAFAGLPVENFLPGQHVALDADHAWRLELDDGTPAEADELFERFLNTPGADKVRALVVGFWLVRYGGQWLSAPPIEELAQERARLPGVTALFVGDVVHAQYPISWVEQGRIHWLLAEYPRLEVLRARGNQEVDLNPVRHESLRQLVLESGGLPARVVRGVGGCDLPALERLELWLGTPDYGGDSTVEDLAPVLADGRFPRLTTLGLRNSEYTDEIAEALASAPVVAQLHTLDLSMGTLTDRGAEALLTGQPLTHLKKLDLHHHFLSDEMAARIVAELPGVEIDLTRQKAPHLDDDDYYDEDDEDEDALEDRYIAVAE